jgi:hypothetical protein
VEQKNGAIVRKIVGYRRFEGLQATRELARLYASTRLFVNFFQPSFKLKEKHRDGAKVIKRYHRPATPCQRLLADPRTPEETRRQLTALSLTLDPVLLLRDIRLAQERLDDRFHETGLDGTGSLLVDSSFETERGVVSWQDGVRRSSWR